MGTVRFGRCACRHGAFGRCFDSMLGKHPEILANKPLRLLKRGNSTYTEEEDEILARTSKGRPNGKEGKLPFGASPALSIGDVLEERHGTRQSRAAARTRPVRVPGSLAHASRPSSR